MRRNAIVVAAAAIGLALLAAGCSQGPTGSAAAEQNISGRVEYNYLINQPPPTFQHSDIRAAAITIEAIQALGEQTTSFGVNRGIKDPVWSCPSLGEPVASTTEITNPQQPFNDGYPQGGTAFPIGNMDPNGIYAGNSTGTYVLCVDAQGRPYAQYWEGFVDTVSGPAVWDTATGTIKVTGAPVMPTCTLTNVGTQKAKTVCVK